MNKVSGTSFLSTVDAYADKLPFASPFTNLGYLFVKAGQAFEGANVEPKSRHFAYIKDKSTLRCFLLLIPIIGNIIVAVMDRNSRKAARALEQSEQAQSTKDRPRSDFRKWDNFCLPPGVFGYGPNGEVIMSPSSSSSSSSLSSSSSSTQDSTVVDATPPGGMSLYSSSSSSSTSSSVAPSVSSEPVWRLTGNDPSEFQRRAPSLSPNAVDDPNERASSASAYPGLTSAVSSSSTSQDVDYSSMYPKMD